jgi:glycosyltransferase involved in cell wall biosynthesis
MELLIAGKGPNAFVQELRSRYLENRRIRFLGHVRPGTFLNSIDLLAVPSLWNDPCPLVVAEAILTGVPVIASRRGGIPELIREGVDGWLFEPTVAGEFAAAVKRAIESELVATEGPRSRAWPKRLTSENMADKYERLYREVL